MLKHMLKDGIMAGLYAVGSLSQRSEVPVIVYHSLDYSGSCTSMRPEDFRRQMQWLKGQGYRTITAKELVDCRKNGRTEPGKTVVLTFDDGYESNYSVLLPILREFGFTATIFLTTGYVGKLCTWDKKDDIADLPLMTWDMAAELVREGIDIQSHTVSHPHLPRLSDEEIRREAKESRLSIEERLRKKCDILCYPYAEFDGRVAKILKEEGYEAAFAGQPEQEGIYSLRRVGSAHFHSLLAFKTAAAGMFPSYYSVLRTVRKIFPKN